LKEKDIIMRFDQRCKRAKSTDEAHGAAAIGPAFDEVERRTAQAAPRFDRCAL
jgi:hypothetical protein